MEKNILLTLSALSIVCLFSTSCSKKIITPLNEKKSPRSENIDKTTGKNIKKKNDLEKKYLSEGFVEKDTFRVIILVPKDSSCKDQATIKYRAEKRAEASLQKFLVSKGRVIDQNTRAEILNLINNHGKLIPRNIPCRGSNVFYFDIQKKHLKRHLKKITQPGR